MSKSLEKSIAAALVTSLLASESRILGNDWTLVMRIVAAFLGFGLFAFYLYRRNASGAESANLTAPNLPEIED